MVPEIPLVRTRSMENWNERNHQDRGEKSSLAEWQGGNKAGSYIGTCIYLLTSPIVYRTVALPALLPPCHSARDDFSPLS